MKKHYLKLYLATCGIHSVSSPYGENPVDVIANSSNNSGSKMSYQATKEEYNAIDILTANLPPKRTITSDDLEEPAPRRRRISSGTMNGDEEWRSICQSATDIFCKTLPGLEEAAVMFGYS